METVHPNFVVMMDVEDLVVSVLQDKVAAMEFALANPTVSEDSAEMTDVDINHVVNAHPLKPAKMVSVLVHLHLTVPEDFVDPTEPEEVAEVALQDKDAVLDNANATMIVTRETAVMQFNLMDLTSKHAPKDLVVLAQLDSLAEPMEDVQLQHLAQSLSQLLIVEPDVLLPLAAVSSSLKSHTAQQSLSQQDSQLHGVPPDLEISLSKPLLKDTLSTLKVSL